MSGTLSLVASFRRLLASLTNVIATDNELFPTAADVGIRVSSDGNVYRSVGTGAPYVSQYAWRTEGALYSSNSYEVKYDGTFAGGSPLSTWISLGADATWTMHRASVGNSSDTGFVYIRDAVTQDIIATAQFFLTVSVSSP